MTTANDRATPRRHDVADGGDKETLTVRTNCRIKDGWGIEHSVRVQYPDGRVLEISESEYRDLQFQPAFEDLQWCLGTT